MPHKQPQLRRFASLDLGTNTFLLLIAEVSEQRLAPIFDKETIVRLGKGVDADGNLSAEAMQRGVECLQEYLTFAQQHHCEKIFAIGTSALRDAANRETFLRRAREETGIEIEIISGETEARLAFFGTLSNKMQLAEPVAVIDIGGGSTEVVIGTTSGISFARSANIGSVRLTERWLHHDPPQPEEIAALREQAEKVMREAWAVEELSRVASLVGTAGTITTLAAMLQRLTDYDPNRIDGFVLSVAALEDLNATLSKLTLSERKQLPGLNPARADVILAGALILEVFLKTYGFKDLIVSNRGLRYGVVVEMMRSLQQRL